TQLPSPDGSRSYRRQAVDANRQTPDFCGLATTATPGNERLVRDLAAHVLVNSFPNEIAR
ncbi:MAG: hypothetical protein KDA51_01810, partial [Planctomycetales bacterium]|nr:hypothetical protein [Planctomycetales bacterium]